MGVLADINDSVFIRRTGKRAAAAGKSGSNLIFAAPHKIMRTMIAIAALAMLLFGCIAQERPPEAAGVSGICISECQRQMLSGRDLSSGPCLMDGVPDYPDWVCDVARSPRVAADNLPENGCNSFASGRARHFIEVTPDCKLIQEY
jgi:hypothetical protein